MHYLAILLFQEIKHKIMVKFTFKKIQSLQDKGFFYNRYSSYDADLKLTPLAIRWLLNYLRNKKLGEKKISETLLHEFTTITEDSSFLPLYIKAVPLEVRDKKTDVYQFIFYLVDDHIKTFRSIRPIWGNLENEIKIDQDFSGGKMEGIFKAIESDGFTITVFLTFTDEELAILKSGQPLIID
ncbi:hypothetical protein F4V57_03825 [Acinetobacter qingfengensis]|uniref:Uncharacterized protein n=1 Tax=Acinetobacter qingfengensis TaxID=1262585 RepID=A0A1E7RC49_9GAMM|nr:hypothetical protein [Acinetobacter qingfengensis]KAA8734897.1 hypothetical protein F4V57_03825 [Acinetobacter qingfengensis]OEY96934.1 hypothetical protein BJI46_11670 [Acinetobacter qingfengensis]